MPRLVLCAPLLAVLALSGAATAARAQDQAITLTGTSGKRCTLGTPQRSQDGALVNFDTPSGSVFSVTHLANPDTLSTQAADITVALSTMCNGLHRVILASDRNGLWRQGGQVATSGFADAVPYRANLEWADEQHPLTADAASERYVEQEVLVGRPATGDLLIAFHIEAGATNLAAGAPLMAGEYADILRVTVEPQ